MHMLVVILSAIITAIFVLGILAQYYLAPFFGVTDICLACLFIISELITTLSVYFQNRLFGQNLETAWSKMITIDKRLHRITHKSENSVTFRQLYYPKFILNVAIMLVHCAVKYAMASPYTHIIVQTSILSLQAFSMLVNLHMLFYIGVIQYFLMSLTQHVYMARHTSLYEYWRANPSAMVDTMVQYKVIYFNIWDVTQMLNAHFGWTLAALCIQNFMDVCYALYWIFLYLQSEHDGFLVISMQSGEFYTVFFSI